MRIRLPTLALKPRGDVTRKSKTCVHQKILKKERSGVYFEILLDFVNFILPVEQDGFFGHGEQPQVHIGSQSFFSFSCSFGSKIMSNNTLVSRPPSVGLVPPSSVKPWICHYQEELNTLETSNWSVEFFTNTQDSQY